MNQVLIFIMLSHHINMKYCIHYVYTLKDIVELLQFQFQVINHQCRKAVVEPFDNMADICTVYLSQWRRREGEGENSCVSPSKALTRLSVL